jgi:DNA replication protein DnaC
MTTCDLAPDELRSRLQQLGLFGLLAQWDEVGHEPWLPQLVTIEEAERGRRSLDRRLRDARLGAFKPIADFDWKWPRQIERQAIEELFSLGFLGEGSNVIFVGPNGVGKTMLLKNLAYHAIVRGHTVRATAASDMLADLAAQDSSTALARRLRRYILPKLLYIDEVGYLSYSSRYADLLFEVVTRRYDAHKPILVSTNKAFSDWSEVFPNATCIVTLVDRLVHRSEIIEIDGDSYRLEEAKERQAKRSASRRKGTKKVKSKP